MRKFVIFLLMFVCVGISAQQKKQVIRKSSVNTEEHMTFFGVPIDGSISSFVNKLSAKGIKMPATPGKHFIKLNGKKAQIELNNKNGFCKIDLYTHILPENSDELGYYFDLTCKEVEKKFKYKKNYYREWSYLFDITETDCQTVYSIFSTKNPSRKIGDISIQTLWGNGEICILTKYYDYSNNLKYNKDDYPYCNSEIEWNENIYSSRNFSIKYGIEKNTGNVFIEHFVSNKIYNYILMGKDKHLFCNLMFACNDKTTRDYFLTNFFKFILENTNDVEETYVFSDMLDHQIETYYAEIEKKRQERERQLAQRKKSYGFMDIMHMLAPSFFTQDDVNLWNKMPEENQKAVINGAFGFFGAMGGSTWDSLSPEQKMQIHQNDNAR